MFSSHDGGSTSEALTDEAQHSQWKRGGQNFYCELTELQRHTILFKPWPE